MVNLNKVLKKDYIPIGWFYIYKDNFAIKELDYSLVAGSKNSKLRNSMIYGTPIHFKINLKYIEYNRFANWKESIIKVIDWYKNNMI